MSEFADVKLTDAPGFRYIYLRNRVFWTVRVRGAWVGEVEINGQIEGLRINGVDVGPLVEAELDRRDPRRAKMRPTHVAGFHEAWAILQALWAETIERARALPPEALHERVEDEWSFIETLRHLTMATDIWISRAVLGDPRPWHPLGLPCEEMEDHPEGPRDRDARPSLDEILAVRAERVATFQRVLDGLTEEQLASHTEPVEGPGYPPANRYPVAECLRTVLNEEWEHRLFAERDLALLEQSN